MFPLCLVQCHESGTWNYTWVFWDSVGGFFFPALALFFFLLWVTQVKRVLIRFTLAALVSVSRSSGRLFQIQRRKVLAPSLRSAK